MDEDTRIEDLEKRLRTVEIETASQGEALKFIRDIVVKIDKDNERTREKTEKIDKDLHNGLLEEKIGPILDKRFSNSVRQFTFRVVTGLIISVGTFFVYNWLV